MQDLHDRFIFYLCIRRGNKRKLRCFGLYVLIDDLTSRACSVIDTICGYSLDLLIDEA